MLLFIGALAFFKDRFRRRRMIGLVVRRGDQSRTKIHLAYGFVSVMMLQVINSTQAWKSHKTIISIVDLTLLLYLSYWNTWYRNKVIGLTSGWERKAEEH